MPEKARSTNVAKFLIPPSFYNPTDAENPDYHLEIAWPIKDGRLRLLDVAAEYRREHNVPILGADSPELGTIGIDLQNSFIFESLAVVGGIQAARRFAEFCYRLARYIDIEMLTGDNHPEQMITTPFFTKDRYGNHAQPLQKEFDESDFLSGDWGINSDCLSTLPGRPTERFMNDYLAVAAHRLKELGRPKLIVWPEHCPELSYGQQIAGVVLAQKQFHGFLRGVRNLIFTKGNSPYVECFSPYGPDYLTFHNGSQIPLAEFNTALQSAIRSLKILVVGGLASTHCVRAFLLDLVKYNPEIVPNTYVMEDCIAPVPGFEHLYAEAKTQLLGLKEPMHFVNSTDPVETWPGVMPQFIARRDRRAV